MTKQNSFQAIKLNTDDDKDQRYMELYRMTSEWLEEFDGGRQRNRYIVPYKFVRKYKKIKQYVNLNFKDKANLIYYTHSSPRASVLLWPLLVEISGILFILLVHILNVYFFKIDAGVRMPRGGDAIYLIPDTIISLIMVFFIMKRIKTFGAIEEHLGWIKYYAYNRINKPLISY